MKARIDTAVPANTANPYTAQLVVTVESGTQIGVLCSYGANAGDAMRRLREGWRVMRKECDRVLKEVSE